MICSSHTSLPVTAGVNHVEDSLMLLDVLGVGLLVRKLPPNRNIGSLAEGTEAVIAGDWRENTSEVLFDAIINIVVDSIDCPYLLDIIRPSQPQSLRPPYFGKVVTCLRAFL